MNSATLQERIAALRARGAGQVEPMRFHALESLARRLPLQPADVQAVLDAKLQAAVGDCEHRLASLHSQPLHPTLPPVRRAAPAGPLAQLTQQLRATAGARAPATSGEPHDPDELAGAHRFRLAWSHGRTLDRVVQALSRKPVQSGPLNSHALVLQSLAMMRELSPDYLRRFVVYVESLQWLEQQAMADARQPGKAAEHPARRARRK